MTENHLTILSENLMKYRTRRELSLKEVAEAIGITYNALSTYEKGTKFPPMEFAIRLAEYYGVSLDELCGSKKKGFWFRSDYHDCLQAYITIRSMGSPQEVKVENVPWSQTKESIDPDEARVWHQLDELGEETPCFRKVTITIHSHRFSSFVEGYEKMRNLVADGLLDEQIFNEWLEKKLAEPVI